MKKSLSTKFAEFISVIFNPILLGLVIVTIAIVKSKMPRDLESTWIIATLILNGAVLAFVYLFLVKRGFVFDDSIQSRKILYGRLVLLIILLVMVTLELLVLVSTNPYQPLLAVFYGAVITLVLGMAITNWWKISWHSAMATFFISMFIFINRNQGWPLTIILALIIWSRLKLKRHTIWQLLGGIALSIGVMLVVLRYFNLL